MIFELTSMRNRYRLLEYELEKQHEGIEAEVKTKYEDEIHSLNIELTTLRSQFEEYKQSMQMVRV